MRSILRRCVSLALLIVALAAAGPASAATVWTDWTTSVAGLAGSASGTLNGVTVSYSGEVFSNRITNGTATLWAPASTYVGGTVTTSPSTVGDVITLTGASTATHTLTFSSPLTDPVFAIWSLGRPNVSASFTFDATPTFQVGGPNANFGGTAITVLGNVVSGLEGNGVVQFAGTFSSISWTVTPENYYGFTLGIASDVVPEPSMLAFLAVAVLGLALRRRSH